MPLALEIVRFRLKEGPSEEELFSTRPSLFELLRRDFPGVRAAYRAKLDDGTWIDVVVWSSREEAETAAREIMAKPQIAALMAHIDEVLSFEHAEVHEALDAALPAARGRPAP